MKVLYILNSTFALGGATKSFLCLLDGMRKRGEDVHVVVPDEEGVCATLRDGHIPFTVLNYRPSTYPFHRNIKERLLFLPRLIARRILERRATKAVQRLIEKEGFDIIHTNVSVIDIGFKAAQRTHTPHIFHFREFADLDFNTHYFPTPHCFHKSVKREGSYTISITESIARHHGLDTYARGCVIYNGVIDEPAPLQPVWGDYLLYAGRLERTKGVVDVIKAYADSQVEMPLYLAGAETEPDTSEEIRAIIATRGLADKVVFLGQRSDVRELMHHARATLIASHQEAFGRCMPEAMAESCLCIAYDSAGTKEQLDLGLQLSGDEIALRYHDTASLASLVTQVATASLDDFLPLIQRALQVVNAQYTAEAYVQKVFEVYEKALPQQPHPVKATASPRQSFLWNFDTPPREGGDDTLYGS